MEEDGLRGASSPSTVLRVYMESFRWRVCGWWSRTSRGGMEEQSVLTNAILLSTAPKPGLSTNRAKQTTAR
jgi:hypothetical protein